jgi:hypothetical protein
LVVVDKVVHIHHLAEIRLIDYLLDLLVDGIVDLMIITGIDLELREIIVILLLMVQKRLLMVVEEGERIIPIHPILILRYRWVVLNLHLIPGQMVGVDLAVGVVVVLVPLLVVGVVLMDILVPLHKVLLVETDLLQTVLVVVAVMVLVVKMLLAQLLLELGV